VAGHPKFRTDLSCSYFDHGDGRTSQIIKNPVSGKYFRVSEYEYQLLKMLDGTVDLDQAREKLRLEGRHYSREQAANLLEKASQMGLVLGTSFGTSEGRMNANALRKKTKKFMLVSHLFFLYIPLINPDPFLERTIRIFRILFNRFSLAAGSLLGVVAVYLIILGIPRIQNEYLFFFNGENLLYLWLVIGITKLVHELGHAYMAKHFGLHVNTMGVAFLLFFPCLYCDTTEAWKLAGRRQRMLISAAGIAVEMVLAILGTYAWYFSKPGVINSLAFYLVVVSFLSTIFFNGNPLLKFDGYFILMDYLRLPNLAGKSLMYVKYLVMNKTLGIASFKNPAGTDRECFVFALYGTSSILYRFFLYFGIVAGLYFRFDKIVGLLIASLAFFLFVVRPLATGITSLWGKRCEVRLRFNGTVAMICGFSAIIMLLLWPWKYTMTFPCFMDSAKVHKITVPLHCSITDVFIRQGMEIKKGTAMFKLEPKALEFALLKAHLERKVLSNNIDMLLLEDKGRERFPEKTVELHRADQGIRKVAGEARLASSGIEAPFDGVVTTLDSRVQEGFEPGDGVIIGELKSPTDCIVHALIPGRFLQNISVGQEVKIWFPIDRGRFFHKPIERLSSVNERDLRDSSFSSLRGGEIAVDVGRAGMETPLEDHYLCSVGFSANRIVPLGMTGRIVVSSCPTSVLARLYGAAVQIFNRESCL